MAARKSPQKKAEKQNKPDEVTRAEEAIIDGIAHEVDPKDAGTKKPKAKTAPRDKTPQTGRMGLMVSLVALLLGITGAGLGGLAYMRIMANDADPQAAAKALTVPMAEDIELLSKRVDDLAEMIIQIDTEQQTAAGARDEQMTRITARVDAVEITLENTLASQQERASEEGADAAQNINTPHRHDDYVTWDAIMAELEAIRVDLDDMTRRTTPPAPPAAQATTDNNVAVAPDEDGGWWSMVMGAFSLSKIDTAPTEPAPAGDEQ